MITQAYLAVAAELIFFLSHFLLHEKDSNSFANYFSQINFHSLGF